MGFLASMLQCPLVFAFGLLGNIISFLIYISPAVPTISKVLENNSTDEFQSLLDMTGLLISSMLWIYYASLKKGAYYLMAINLTGCVTETFPTCFIYSPRRIRTLMLLLILSAGGFCLIVFLIDYLAPEQSNVMIVGLICYAFSVLLFHRPLSSMWKVFRTRSVEFMSFTLTFFITLDSVMWFFYGYLLEDSNIAAPNILGFIVGVLQMLLYFIYRNSNIKKFEQKERQIIEEDRLNLSTILCSKPLYPVDQKAQEAKAEVISKEQKAQEKPVDEKERDLNTHSPLEEKGETHNG